MEGQQFDAWTKALAAGQSRRTVLKGLAAGIVGGLVGLARSRIASAATPCTSGVSARRSAAWTGSAATAPAPDSAKPATEQDSKAPAPR